MHKSGMEVIKRNGRIQEVKFDKITERIKNLQKGNGLEPLDVDPVLVAKDVIRDMHDKIKTSDLDNLASEIAASFTTKHPDYSRLAARISISNLHKRTPKTFSKCIIKLHLHKNENGKCPLVSKEVYTFILSHHKAIDAHIVDTRDLNMYDYFGFKTLERSYLLKINGQVIERPQYMIMRVALGIHIDGSNSATCLKSVFETYDLMSQGYFTHASPTLYNSGTPRNQFSSCFLLNMSDSIEGIFKTVTDSAKLSKFAGGIGIHMNTIRGSGSYIKGTNGSSSGIVPWLRILNATAKGVNQGGRRPGSIAVYIEPWHSDIFQFLEMKRNTGNEEDRARGLFYGLWINDEFMRRVEKDEMWSLMCPNICKGLVKAYGEEFDKLYKQYENEGRYVRQVKARDLWREVITSQIETGTPYMLYKDACNKKNNQKNLGTLKGSNLCAEILIYTSDEEVGTCNLASIALGSYVKVAASSDLGPIFDFQKLDSVCRVIVRNLNKIIDTNYYVIPESKNSNLKHRPIAIGTQGLWDCFMKMKMPFTSSEAKKLNKQIFECIYYACLDESCELARRDGAYSSFEGSPFSRGEFQFDLVKEHDKRDVETQLDWSRLRERVREHGMRNSLLTALMPCASTAQILGSCENNECITNNLYYRRVLSGEHCVLNKYLVKDLLELGLWNESMKNKIIENDGSVQGIPEIPAKLQELYMTMYELKKKDLNEMAMHRQDFVDQTQSYNIFIAKQTFNMINTIHMDTWRRGLKTGIYYLRSKAATKPIQLTLAPKKETEIMDTGPPDCEACS